ncbi:hypothetical protein PhCBS80983_g03072 [Powellomyces hirtus]|uniref:Peripheral subunit-binding (PSBD) domain-containing protein n=1 Tax=Powellomyces hirtus TaxID=109895 RepID=A0A507E5W7_9FUNG|nr:hypothetical protein PhCBS80983_g03072 [Powellomyces hirtus]
MLRVLQPAQRQSSRCIGQATARFASTATAGAEVLSPAVAFLVGRKKIDQATVRRLPRSGPKNRLLKGDVLRFLANPSILDNVPEAPTAESSAETSVEESFIPAAYYGTRVNVNDLVTFVKNYNDQRKATLSVSDLFTRAAHLALQAVPEVNSHWVEGSNSKQALDATQILINRLSPFGVTRMVLKKAEDVGGVQINKSFKDEGSKVENAGPLFCIYDTVLSPFAEVSPYPSQKNPVILTIGSIRKEHRTPRGDDVLDFLTGPSNTTRSKQPPQANIVLDEVYQAKPSVPSAVVDDIDFLSKPPPSSFYTGSFSGECEPMVDYMVSVDLTVDARAVSQKSAQKFLATWEKILKSSKTLL